MHVEPGHVLHHLQSLSPTARWAFLIHKNQVFYAGTHAFKAHPSSAVVKLLQGLFDQHRDYSFFLLR